MSILLEALRKTEQQQRPAPTIHDEDPPGSAPEPMFTWPVLAMMAMALIASSWAVWRQYEAPEGVYRPPVTLAPDQASGPRTQTVGESSAAAAPARVQEIPAVAPEKPLAQPQARLQRTPVETYSPPAANASSPDSAPVVPEGSRSTTASGDSQSSAAAAAARMPAAGATRPPSESMVQQAPEPHVPEPIGYWELPDAVRADVPEIKFSVLVYDDDPSARFVLASGQRLAEGDSLQPGVTVEEIRRDGVVFKYRLYRFLVER